MILNYNGKALLEECLPSALEAVAAFGRPCPVAVVDNRSTEGDLDYIRQNFPMVETILAAENDYLFSLNAAVAQRAEEVILILNNDMTFDPDFIAPLLKYFHRPDVFAVTGRVLTWDRQTVMTRAARGSYGAACGTLSSGRSTTSSRVTRFTLPAAQPPFAARCSSSSKASIPCSAPAYYEEVDLSYRAWKRGWKVIYEPLQHHDSPPGGYPWETTQQAPAEAYDS